MKRLGKTVFEELFRQHYASLCHYAVSIMSDPEQSEDIVQKAFIKLWDRRSEMDMERSIKSYLYTMVRNASINFLRDKKKFSSSFLDLELFIQNNASGIVDGLENLQAEELSNKIQNAIEKLPEKSLEVFNLSRFEHLKYKEIAEKLNVTVKTVEAHMSRALKILREELKDYLVLWMVIAGVWIILKFMVNNS